MHLWYNEYQILNTERGAVSYLSNLIILCIFELLVPSICASIALHAAPFIHASVMSFLLTCEKKCISVRCFCEGSGGDEAPRLPATGMDFKSLVHRYVLIFVTSFSADPILLQLVSSGSFSAPGHLLSVTRVFVPSRHQLLLFNSQVFLRLCGHLLTLDSPDPRHPSPLPTPSR